ncbi:C6 zinc finger domain-containing protein [Verticillium dahliae VdLs.17]|uniref:C6 zinc finger domain-containing protein n=1 Tax=Verticillium dahliae (strain VdLs.17 / ATCC MYA-4575 / FGSC 10137) TaxID=498257 RepID=G2X8E5_VERDV|nr:C6 zinc finger domain-containing protein [Verticillium dahliae VdLs.17]EGY15232.1 C6 zinc finger domain-containing protein [Verticillium dahliae VdLs.17]KAH6697874.1 C6 zinc finger domain-containing protein [Verticillium dahliae]
MKSLGRPNQLDHLLTIVSAPLDCKIESNFKRVGKRSKHAEMEKEIDTLRRKLGRAQAQGFTVDDDDHDLQSPVAASAAYTHTRNPSLMGSDEAVSSLLHLKRGGSYNMPRYTHELENVRLTEDSVSQLFNMFFNYYHPYLPFLNPHQSPDTYYQQHSLLFWTIVAVAARRYSADPTLLTTLSGPLTRLLWQTIGDVPSSYYVVKALCLLCTWPLPTSTTTADPTHILCGVMLRTATGIGLHRPNHTQDFSRVSVDLNKEQLHDRVTTWAVCNIVAQSIGTGYGQPASTLYDWTLAVRRGEDGPFTLSPVLEARLQIERFCDKVSKEMYSNASDSRGVAGDEHRAMLMRVYRRDYGELQASILSQHLGPIVNLHLRAAALHLRLAGFFDSNTTPGYMDDLMGLWRATTAFLDHILEDDKVTSPGQNTAGHILLYASNYIQQMLVAAGFALLKLSKSFFAEIIEAERSRSLFHKTLNAIRATSVINNDLQSRLAELMVQMWNGARHDIKSVKNDEVSPRPVVDDTLQLKVRCRHSMSLVFDSVWRWREDYQAQGRGTLDGARTIALKQPTNPDSANESSASSTHMDSTLMPAAAGAQNLPQTSGNMLAATNGALTPGTTAASLAAPASANGNAAANGTNSNLLSGINYTDNTNYDFFDPQHWMLDGLLDFNYSFAQPLEGA